MIARALIVALLGTPFSEWADAKGLIDHAAKPAKSLVVPVFRNVTSNAGVNVEHTVMAAMPTDPESITAGAAAADINSDGYLDLFVVRGNSGEPDRLFQNSANGRMAFSEIAHAAGVDRRGIRGSGPVFTDINGDGIIDLFVGAVDHDPVALYLGNGDGTFSEGTTHFGLDALSRRNTMSAAFADYDRDGDLDMALSHWDWDGTFGDLPAISSTQTLWRNDSGKLVDHAEQSGLNFAIGADGRDFSFTPNFADINNDQWPDLLLASDFATSQIFINATDGTFIETTAPVISDRNGMGGSVADYDNDGDLDWFVSAIASEEVDNPGFDGNRLYRNLGDGSFEDVTDAAGVRIGGWGWGSCFADFNNDGLLDIFHVNGWYDERFAQLPSKLFLARGDGSFEESALAAGIFSDRQGRGLVCADFDRDGDIDLFIANNRTFSELYQNDLSAGHHWMTVSLQDYRTANTQGIGARVWLESAGVEQMREIQAGGNFVSANPAEAHFGLGGDPGIDLLTVRWPDGTVHTWEHVQSDRLATIVRSGSGQAVLWYMR